MNAEMKAQVKQLLVAGRTRIADERNWAQGPEVDSTSGRYCAATAIQWWNTMLAHEQLIIAAGGCCFADLFIYNDTHSHAEVLALYDKAIAACEEQP